MCCSPLYGLILSDANIAAQDLNVEVQYCMANAHQILMSLDYPSVTNARANGDGGLDTGAFRMQPRTPLPAMAPTYHARRIHEIRFYFPVCVNRGPRLVQR